MKKSNLTKLLLLSVFGVSILNGCNSENNSSSNTNSTNASSQNSTSQVSSSTSSKVNNSNTSSTSSSNDGTKDELTIESMSIIGSYKTTYYLNETLDLANVKLAVIYSDGSKETIDVTEEMITPVDMTTVGLKEVVVTYKGETESFYITVEEKKDNPIPSEKVNPTVTFNYESGASFTVGASEKPEVTVSEGATYTTHFSCEEKEKAGETYIFNTYEELEPGFAYSLVVEVTEDDNYNYYKEHRWFHLLEAPSLDKANPVITFNYESGASFTVGASEKPEVTVSEGATYTTHFSCEEKQKAGETYIFDTYEELEPGFAYSLVVEVIADDNFNGAKEYRWFNLLAAPSLDKLTATITFNYEPGTSYTIGSNERPTVTVTEGANYVITYSSDTTGYNSTEYPTVAGTYSLVVEVIADDNYNYSKEYRWFRLVEDKPSPEVTFSIETGTTLILGEDSEPTVTVTEGLNYTVQYNKDEKFYSNTFPTEAGTYAMIVNVEGNENYASREAYIVFTLVESGETIA